MTRRKIELDKLTAGYEFPPATFRLEEKLVTAYLTAVEDENKIYKEHKIAPPLAIAALAMAAMGKQMSLPAGSIHVSQQLQFVATAGIGKALTSHARVNRRVERGRLNMMTVGISVLNQEKAPVLTGETSFILPSTLAEK